MAARVMPLYLTKRAGLWHYARRVPDSVTHLDRRGVVKQSTKVRVADDPRGLRAARIAEVINATVEEYWLALLNGQANEAQRRYDAVRKLARGFGYDYAVARDIAAAPLVHLLGRVETVAEQPPALEAPAVAALLGGEDPPQIRLSSLCEEFERINRATNRDLSPDQLRKWRNPKLRAVANLISVVGDRGIDEVKRTHALMFRSWWNDRVLTESVEIATANKDFTHLNAMFKEIERFHQLGLEPVFADLRIAGGTNGQRIAFSSPFVQARLLADGALEGLNDEARRIVLLIVETGLRLSEACNLTAETIRLEESIPHVRVRPEGRRMKTEQSERDIPLVGVSLMAARLHPCGFPRYRDKAASLSALVNKVMSGRGLLPGPGYTLYSLRHTFEDRLTKAEAPDRVAAALMGHKFHRPRYGLGPSLEQKLEWLQRIAFTPPSRV